MMQYRLALTGLILLCCASTARAAFYCGNALIKTGDPLHYVERACPEPFYIETLHGHAAYHIQFNGEGVWYLNFGPGRMMRRLEFRHGYLRRIDELDYGFLYAPGSRTCSARELRNAGRTTAEIFARCGEPDYIYVDSPGHHHGIHGHHHFIIRERWIYSLGPGSLDRELLFEDRRLVRITAIPR